METIILTAEQLMLVKLTEWNCQRFLVKDRIGNMKKSILEYKFLCGCIVIHESTQRDEDTTGGDTTRGDTKETISILIDGQHRYYAIKELLEEHKDLSFLCVTVQIIRDNSVGPFEYFKMINDTNPLDIKDESEFTINISNEVTKIFEQNYKDFFKLTFSPQKPNLNKNMFAKIVRKIMKINGINNSTADINMVIELVNDYNTELKKNLANYNLTSSQKTKAIKHNFYIGIERDTDKITKNRTKFTMPFKISVWKKYHNNCIDSPCIGCGKTICMNDAHMSHIVSVKDGGDDTLENILPLCAACNLSCGTKNAISFVHENRHRLNLPLLSLQT